MTSPLSLRKALCLVGLPALAVQAQTVLPEPDPAERPGERPYEMVWARRAEPAPPTVKFDQLRGWTMETSGGAQATLQVTRAQTVWDRPVARLRYRGDGQATAKPNIRIVLPQPVRIPASADSVDLWAHGNRWDWENPPGTPPVRISLRWRDADQKEGSVQVAHVRWQEWWLAHQRLSALGRRPVDLIGLEIAGGWQPEWREVYLDSIRFYREDLSPLTLTSRPRRNLKPLAGQSSGANTGPGKLPFPTREETILPLHLSGPFHNRVSASGSVFLFHYRGQDGQLVYRFDPAEGLGGIRAEFGESGIGPLMEGAGVRLPADPAFTNRALLRTTLHRDRVEAQYADGTTLCLRIWQKSLVVDVTHPSGEATELDLGQVSGVQRPRTVWLPYLNYGGGAHPCVLVSQTGTNHVFLSLWLDWYRSNGSEPFAAEKAETNTARINGGVRYRPRTDGRRNPLFERLFVTLSPRFEEVLPTIPTPVGLHADQAIDRLWQESWGPEDFAKQMRRSRQLRAYGIDRLIQCNHEIAWRDGGESFTLRVHAAPKKGGDSALAQYVAHQRGLGWLAGLYSNYTDYAPVNEYWTPDGVQRTPEGNWRTAWPRCYALKPLKAVEFDARLAPQIKRRYQPTSAYTDVHTAVAPWAYCDYDARVPGAGTFAQTLYAYGELLRNDSRVYASPVFSEGTYQWLYAGLADGNYALAYDDRPLAKEPLLPVFDLYQIHPKECDIGMGWTAHFCDAIPDWRAPANLDRAIDRFLLHTLAYGHIGWLVEEDFGWDRTCRSYYMLQAVQARYGLKLPERIAYWDGQRLVSVSEAVVRDLPRERRQLCVAYPGGLQLWFNDHPTEGWTVKLGRQEVVLPPAGWAAFQPKPDLLSYSALDGANRIDYLRSEAYTYLDGRGHWSSMPEAATDGAIAIRPLPHNRLELVRITGKQAVEVRRPYRVRGQLTECTAYDVDGKALATPVCEDDGKSTRVPVVDKAVRYVLQFSREQR